MEDREIQRMLEELAEAKANAQEYWRLSEETEDDEEARKYAQMASDQRMKIRSLKSALRAAGQNV